MPCRAPYRADGKGDARKFQAKPRQVQPSYVKRGIAGVARRLRRGPRLWLRHKLRICRITLLLPLCLPGLQQHRYRGRRLSLLLEPQHRLARRLQRRTRRLARRSAAGRRRWLTRRTTPRRWRWRTWRYLGIARPTPLTQPIYFSPRRCQRLASPAGRVASRLANARPDFGMCPDPGRS